MSDDTSTKKSKLVRLSKLSEKEQKPGKKKRQTEEDEGEAEEVPEDPGVLDDRVDEKSDEGEEGDEGDIVETDKSDMSTTSAVNWQKFIANLTASYDPYRDLDEKKEGVLPIRLDGNGVCMLELFVDHVMRNLSDTINDVTEKLSVSERAKSEDGQAAVDAAHQKISKSKCNDISFSFKICFFI
jgi:hypothetical protein